MGKVLIAETNRLLREMLSKAINANASLEIVKPPAVQGKLPEWLKTQNIDWVIVSTANSGSQSADEILLNSPEVGILEVAPDGSPVRVRWLKIHEHPLTDTSLADVIDILSEQVTALPGEN